MAYIAAAAGLAIATASPASAAGAISVSASSGLTAGQEVTVTASGFGAGDTLIFAQCAAGATSQDGCAAGGAATKKAGADGGASATLKIVVGAVGTKGGVCDAAHACEIAVTDLSTIGQPGGPTVVTKSITFAASGGGTETKTPTATASTKKPASSGTSKPASSAPGSELAHTGGDGNTTLLIGAASGALVLLGAGVMFTVRRRGTHAN
ncbi:neocarzinostatin apoprotein domain-containing protein [Yinghuangia seranimata]|uniref:neocarzinostatin apoprotein domain-containing protein n=1 Tax=Yinghuangia seranimata TaxID=408067 RepID=UPI00248C8F83|nr:neocarzinostatin apoprotein domain-containing protein [Yinghuangia seranimata]MDI2132430.1 neocarzinostatin apoprotein domain-containing protein [Yinghuangia seranimata]